MRALNSRPQQPLLPPKGKVLRAVTPEATPGPIPELYAPAKLRVDVLQHVKVYCALHQLEIQKFLTGLAEAELRRQGYLPGPPAPPLAEPPAHG